MFVRLRPAILIFVFSCAVFAQKFPDKIRGYKVYETKISVTNQSSSQRREKDSEAFARLDEPQLVETSLSGLTFEIAAEIEPLDYRGKVDFLTFHDFKVNGLSVEIDEYDKPFEIKKNQSVKLPSPVKIFIGSGQILKGAFAEWRDSKEDWAVTGTVFVFGHFKKWGLSVKRVVPVAVKVKIKNPLAKK